MNTGLTFYQTAEGVSVGVISADELMATDIDNSAAELSFKVSKLPEFGFLFIDNNGNNELDDGEGIALNADFSQADIDSGKVKYLTSGSAPVTDSFEFSLADTLADGVAPITGNVFNISLLPNEPPVMPGQASWAPLGAELDMYANNTAIFIDGEGRPLVGYTVGGKVRGAIYQEGEWVPLGEVAVPASQVYSMAFAVNAQQARFAVYLDSESGKVNVSKLVDDRWEPISVDGIPAGTTESLALSFDSKGTAYLSYYLPGETGKLVVWKLDNGTWVPVTELVMPSGSDISSVVSAIAFDSQDNLHLAYLDSAAGNKGKVKKWLGDEWQALGEQVFNGKARSVSLAFNSEDIPHLAYEQGDDGDYAAVKQFIGGQWYYVGGTGFTNGWAGDISLAFGPDDQAYIAYTGNGSAEQVMVQRLETGNIELSLNAGGGLLAGRIQAEDNDNDQLRYELLEAGDHAVVTLDADSGEIHFISTPNFTADGDNQYRLWVKVSDGKGGSAVAPVTIKVTPPVPVTPPTRPVEPTPEPIPEPTPEPGISIIRDYDLDGNTQTRTDDSGDEQAVVKVPLSDESGNEVASPELISPTALNASHVADESGVKTTATTVDESGQQSELSASVSTKGVVEASVASQGNTVSFSSADPDTKVKLHQGCLIETETSTRQLTSDGQLQPAVISTRLGCGAAQVGVNNYQDIDTKLAVELDNSATTINEQGDAVLTSQLPNGVALTAKLTRQGQSQLTLSQGAQNSQLTVEMPGSDAKVEQNGDLTMTSAPMPVSDAFTFNGEQKAATANRSVQTRIKVQSDGSIQLVNQLLEDGVVVDEAEPIQGHYFIPGAQVIITSQDGLPETQVTTKLTQPLAF